jgi:hypothetical protein
MVLFFSFLIVILCVSWIPVHGKQQRYEAIDEETFNVYTPHWSDLHASWIGINPDYSFCKESTETTVYPVCVGDYLVKESYLESQLISDDLCPAVQCLVKSTSESKCSFTPFDTIDYLPPVPTSSSDSAYICNTEEVGTIGDSVISSLTYGMDLGIPPLFLPVIPVRLNISGFVTTFSSSGANGADTCMPIENAKIEAWQIDPTALDPFTVDSQFRLQLDTAAAEAANKAGTPFSGTTTGGRISPTPESYLSSPRNTSLRDLSCRGTQHTSRTGRYSFLTYVPPSYGPPRHVMFQVSAPGYQTLTTRMYFDLDWRLQQLTTLRGEVHGLSATGPDSLPLGLKFPGDLGYAEASFPGPVARDPRVTKLTFTPSTPADPSSSEMVASSSGSIVSGVLSAEFSFVLRPTRAVPRDPTTATRADGAATSGDGDTSVSSPVASSDRSGLPPLDLTGIWADARGALVRIETHGPSLLLFEYPHPRSWGSAMGMVVGDTIRGVNFMQVVTPSQLSDAKQQRPNPLVRNSLPSVIGFVLQTFVKYLLPS